MNTPFDQRTELGCVGTVRAKRTFGGAWWCGKYEENVWMVSTMRTPTAATWDFEVTLKYLLVAQLAFKALMACFRWRLP